MRFSVLCCNMRLEEWLMYACKIRALSMCDTASSRKRMRVTLGDLADIYLIAHVQSSLLIRCYTCMKFSHGAHRLRAGVAPWHAVRGLVVTEEDPRALLTAEETSLVRAAKAMLLTQPARYELGDTYIHTYMYTYIHTHIHAYIHAYRLYVHMFVIGRV